MSDAQCVKYPIRPGQREAVVHWIAGLKDRSAEVAEAMAEAGLLTEAVFLERTDNRDYVLIYTRAEDLQAGNKVLSSSQLPLIQEFNQLMSQAVDLDRAVSLELIYHTP